MPLDGALNDVASVNSGQYTSMMRHGPSGFAGGGDGGSAGGPTFSLGEQIAGLNAMDMQAGDAISENLAGMHFDSGMAGLMAGMVGLKGLADALSQIKHLPPGIFSAGGNLQGTLGMLSSAPTPGSFFGSIFSGQQKGK